MSKDRVLVTGATGFIAKHCIVELLARGYNVRATVRSPDKCDAVRSSVSRIAGGAASDHAIEFAIADLMRDDGWADAMSGCRFVLHVASPFPLRDPEDREALIGPARDGALRVIKAAAKAGIERVVMTSSMAAVVYVAGPPLDRPMTEDDWTDPDKKGLTAYLASKTIAERAVWAWVGQHEPSPSLVTIQPGLVLGPALDDDLSSSLKVIQLYAQGSYPALPRVSYPISDVRDVARMHVDALQRPEVGGLRLICANGTLTVGEMMRLVTELLPDLKKKVPTFECSDLVIRGLALFDRSARSLIPDLGRHTLLDNSRAREKLGFTFHSPQEAVRSAAESMRALGLI